MGFMASSPWSHSDPHLSTLRAGPGSLRPPSIPSEPGLAHPQAVSYLKGAQEYSPVYLVTPVLSPWVAM